MGRPQNNGLVEFVDEKIDGKSFFCMDLVGFMFNDETTKVWETWHDKFTQAKSGNCPYRDKCTRYTRTMEQHKGEPRQLTLF